MSFLEEHLNDVVLGNAYELIKKIPDKSIDLIYTDPPYEFNGGGQGFKKNGKENIREMFRQLEEEGILKGIDMNILKEFLRVLKKPNIFIWCNKKQLYDYIKFFEPYQYPTDILIWHKTNVPPLYNTGFINDIEYCIYVRKNIDFTTEEYDDAKKVFTSPMNTYDKEKFGHPTIKPLKMVKRHIKHTTHKGEIVLDPFCGSGTTCVACKELGLNYIGFELNEKYVKVSKNRLNGIDKNGQMSIFTDFENV